MGPPVAVLRAVQSDFVLKERTGGVFSRRHGGLTFCYSGLTVPDFDDHVGRNTA
jgi:hypothetical protein